MSVKPRAIELITEEMKNELMHRVGVEGAMGGNVTLTSIIPLGSGKNGFLYPGSYINPIFAQRAFIQTIINNKFKRKTDLKTEYVFIQK